jgi:hypothetical protein
MNPDSVYYKDPETGYLRINIKGSTEQAMSVCDSSEGKKKIDKIQTLKLSIFALSRDFCLFVRLPSMTPLGEAGREKKAETCVDCQNAYKCFCSPKHIP